MNQPSIKQLLQKFYVDNNFSEEGGSDLPYVKVNFTKKFYFFSPNFDARRKAVIKHDIHHMLTLYPTTIAGESEISAWEIGSGCTISPTAFFINTSGAMTGVLFNFPRVIKAFARGRRTENLYNSKLSIEEIEAKTVSELQEEYRLNKYSQNTAPNLIDILLFLSFILYGMVYSLFILPLLVFLILYSIYVILVLKPKS